MHEIMCLHVKIVGGLFPFQIADIVEKVIVPFSKFAWSVARCKRIFWNTRNMGRNPLQQSRSLACTNDG